MRIVHQTDHVTRDNNDGLGECSCEVAQQRFAEVALGAVIVSTSATHEAVRVSAAHIAWSYAERMMEARRPK